MDPVLGTMTGVTLGMLLVSLFVLGRVSAVASRTERKLDMLLKHSGIDLGAASADMVADLVRRGKKIDAIKIYREMTGCGLADAKAHIETLM